jgi:hypothetical protein
MASYSSNNGRKRNSGARAGAGVLAVLVAGTFLTACSENDEDTKSQPTSTAPASAPATTASPSPEAQARADVLVVYRRAEKFFESVQKKGRIDEEDVTNTLTGKARGLWAASGLKYQQQGIRLEGAITRTPEISALDLSGKPPTATVVDCIDVSAARVIDAKTGVQKKAVEGQAPRYFQTTSLIQENGRWLVADVVPERGRTC